MATERLGRIIDERAVVGYVKNKRYVDEDSFKAMSKVRSLEKFLR